MELLLLDMLNKLIRIIKTFSAMIDCIHTNATFGNQISPFGLYADISDRLPICTEVKYKQIKKKTLNALSYNNFFKNVWKCFLLTFTAK